MSRKPRLYLPGLLYHIISSGNNQQKIFLTERDYAKFLTYLRLVKKRNPFFLSAYCLMPNHFHLLLETREHSPSVIMQRLLTAYTAYFGHKYKRKGHLFRGRYKSIICERDSYFLELVRYIHLNPVRAGITRSASDWKWSGHGEYVEECRNPMLEKSRVLEYFGSDISKAVKGYSSFISDGVGIGHKEEFYPGPKTPYLGCKEFVADLSVRQPEETQKLSARVKFKNRNSMEDLIEEIAKKSNLRRDIIQGSTKLAIASKARKEFIQKAIESGHKMADVAQFLNCTAGYISRIANEQME